MSVLCLWASGHCLWKHQRKLSVWCIICYLAFFFLPTVVMFSTSEVKGSRTCWCHGSINITKAQCLVCPVYMLRMKPLGDLESENSFSWANAEIYEHLPALSSWFLLNLFSSRAKPEYYQRFSVRTMQAPFSTTDFSQSPSSKVAMKARFKAKTQWFLWRLCWWSLFPTVLVAGEASYHYPTAALCCR